MTHITQLRGGRVLHADGNWSELPLSLADGQIAAQANDGAPGRWLDASGCFVLPGIVDFHGDAFERQIMPRPNVHFPMDVAMLDTDRQLAANGITTALHGITFSWEGGLRGRDTAYAIFDSLDRLQAQMRVDHRIHLRYECHNLAGEDDAMGWLRSGRISLLAFNEHLPSMQKRRDNIGKMREYAERAGTDVAGFLARMDAAAARGNEVPGLIRRLAQCAASAGVPMASHDDYLVSQREEFHAMKCRVAEFPLNREVAERARELGDPIVCGSPNVVRGGSHIGAPSAADMVREGLCSILATDYYYPAPLAAACRLVQDEVCNFAQAWALISTNPANALGMVDRGRIAAGQRADLVVVDASDLQRPQVIATICAGKLVHLNDGGRMHGGAV